MKFSGRLSGFVAMGAAVLLAVALGMPGVALAQRPASGTPNGSTEYGVSKDGTRPPNGAAAPAAKLTKEQYQRGAKDVPALIPAAGIVCTPDQMVWKGKGTDPKTKIESNAYEVSCKEGLGYVLVTSSADPKPKAFDCLAAASSPQVCALPGNADPKRGVGMRAAAAGRPCDVTQASYVGTSPTTGQTFYELACSAGGGFQLAVNGAQTETVDCITLIGSGRECKLTTPAQAMAAINPAIQRANRPSCATKDTRFIGNSTDGQDTYFEIACQSGPGYILDVDSKLAFKQAVDCSRAAGIGGGCKLTDTTVTESADAATYTRLAQKSGFQCDVAKYRFIGTDKQNREVVELACKNRPDGVVALFSESGKSDLYDCVRAGALGQDCKLSSPDVLYGKYTAALASKGKGTCKVSGARFIGRTETSDYIETACSDGLPGWVMAFSPGAETPSELLTCKQATNAGAACKLPTNLAGNGG